MQTIDNFEPGPYVDDSSGRYSSEELADRLLLELKAIDEEAYDALEEKYLEAKNEVYLEYADKAVDAIAERVNTDTHFFGVHPDYPGCYGFWEKDESDDDQS